MDHEKEQESLNFDFDPTEPLHQFQILFEEPENAAEPEAVRVENLHLEPLEGGRLLDLKVRLTPFRFRPHVSVMVHDAQGNEVAAVDVIEPMLPDLSFTLHLPQPRPGRYTVSVEVLYPEPEHMPKTPAEQRMSRGELKPLPPMRVVHRAEQSFRLGEATPEAD